MRWAGRVRGLAGGLLVVGYFCGCNQLSGNTEPVTVFCHEMGTGGCTPCNRNDDCASGACCSGVCTELDLQIDAANCGACGHDCIGGQCVAGLCPDKVWAKPQPRIIDLVADTQNLYWYSAQTIWQVPHQATDTPSPQLLVSGVPDINEDPKRLAADGSFVYWTTLGSVSSIDVVAAIQKEVVTVDADMPFGLALGGENVYWTNSCTDNGIVRMAAKNGSSPASPAPVDNGQGCPRELVVSGTNPYWVNAQVGGIVNYVDTQDCNPDCKHHTLGGNNSTASLLAVGSNNIYYAHEASSGAYEIYRVAPSFATKKLLASGSGTVRGLAASEDSVFWTETSGDACSVFKVAADGGDAFPLARLAWSDCGRIAVSDSFVYWVWSNGMTSEIARVAR